MKSYPNALQERFLKEIDNLNFRFPGAQLVKDLGYNSGIISEYLNSKKTVSEKFMKSFCKFYNIDYDVLLREVKESIIHPINTPEMPENKDETPTLFKRILDELIKRKLVRNKRHLATQMKFNIPYIGTVMEKDKILPVAIQDQLHKLYGVSKIYMQTNGAAGTMFESEVANTASDTISHVKGEFKPKIITNERIASMQGIGNQFSITEEAAFRIIAYQLASLLGSGNYSQIVDDRDFTVEQGILYAKSFIGHRHLLN